MTHGLKPYPAYKDSGVPCLGTIPVHWEVRRVGRLFSERKQTGYQDLPILEVSLKTGVRVRDLEDVKRKQIIENRATYKRAVKSDIAYNMMRMWQGAVGVVPVDGLVSPAYVVARPFPEADSRYYAYLFRTNAYMSEVNKYSHGIVTDRNRLYWDEFKQIPSALPPTEEQIAIADYLDVNASLNRGYIRAKRRLIDLLNEQKQTIIYRAVTRGLDPNVRLKPSDIVWLGDLPEHWEIVRLKNIAEVVLGKMLKTTPSPGEHLKPYLRSANIQWIRPKLDDVASMWFTESEMRAYRLRKGDVLVSEGGEVGRACLWSDEIPECYIQNSVHKVTPVSRVHPRFLLYQFCAIGKKGYFESIVNRVSIAHLTREKLVDIRFLVPPREEQVQILQEIDGECPKIDAGIERAQREIALLREYRTRLIADVVTGKVDVRELAAGLPEVEDAETLDDMPIEVEATADEDPELAEEDAGADD